MSLFARSQTAPAPAAFHRFILPAALLALGCVACGGQGLVLSADPMSAAADGIAVIDLTAEVTFRGGAIADGKSVYFTTDAPVLFETLDDTVARVPEGRPPGKNEVKVSARAGEARAYLLVPTTAMNLSVTASYTTVNKDVLEQTVAITIDPPPPVSAASNVGGNLGGVVPHFAFSCARKNVGGFFTNRPEISVECALVAEDHDGHPLPHTPVDFYVEAGQIVDTPATDSTPRTTRYVVAALPAVLPRDVRADTPGMSAEADRGLAESGAGLIPGAIEQNPRDGLVTILAVAHGDEAYDDDNHNGRWDEGEFFRDEGEPFLDVDDDGVYDPIVDGDYCCDTNGNGKVDGPNGVFDSDVLIGRMTHILWTGPIVVGPGRTQITPAITGNWLLSVGAQETLTLRVVDGNFNPVAAAGSSDDISYSLTGEPSRQVDFFPSRPQESLGDVLGLDLVADFPSFVFGQAGDPIFAGLSLAGTLLAGREWQFVVRDNRTSTTTKNKCYTWTATATIDHTPGEGSGFNIPQTLVQGSGNLDNACGDLLALRSCDPACNP